LKVKLAKYFRKYSEAQFIVEVKPSKEFWQYPSISGGKAVFIQGVKPNILAGAKYFRP
jgi:hypothetical protein